MGNKLSLTIKNTNNTKAMKIASHRRKCHNVEGDRDLKIKDTSF